MSRILEEIARLPKVYTQELEMIYNEGVPEHIAENLEATEREMLKALKRLEVQATKILKKYRM